MKKLFHISLVFFSIFLGILFFSINAQAYDKEYKEDNWFCNDSNATGSGTCIYRFVPRYYEAINSPYTTYPLQFFEMSFTGHLEGHGSFGPAGGKGAVSGCLSRSSSMWDGACWNWVSSDDGEDGDVGDDDVNLGGGGSIGNDFNSAYKYAIFDFYVNDAGWDNVDMKTTGRGVEIVEFKTNDNSVNVGQSFTITWENDWSDFQTLTFVPSNLVSCSQSGGINSYGTSNCTATGAGTVTVTLEANGPTGDGFKTLTNNLTVTIAQPGPGDFSLELDDHYFHNSHCDFELDWTTSQYATNYEVFEREGGGSWTSIGTTVSTNMQTHSQAWENMSFKVDAINAVGRRTSNTVSAECEAPTVDLKARVGTSGSYTNGPITVAYNGTAQLNWVTSNATSCTASNAWSGSKTAAGGTQTLNNLTTSGTYVLACSNAGGTVTDTPVVINVNAPPMPVVTISTNPTSVAYAGSSTITWSVTNATSCTGSGDWSGSKNATGSTQGTGSLTQVRTYTYTLSCTGAGGTDIESATVVVSPPTPDTPTNITRTEPDYCISGPGITIGWTYSDGSGSPQSAYQVQIDDQSSFNSPEVDSGKITSGANSWATSPGQLTFGVTYRARVRTWNGYDAVSGWSNASSTWVPPQYPYPQVNFTWTTPVQEDVVVPFTDQTVFGGGNVNNRQWAWNFGDGGSSTAQNPNHTFANTGNFTIMLTATDAAGQSCSRQQNISVQKPIPVIKEVAPK